MNEVSALLLKWHEKIDRDLPWKSTLNPYFIWVSEIILQQTRVEQGTPYYLRFVSEFPSIKDLAEASQEEVYKLWEGLGYYSRARNMHETAKYIHQSLDGNFPSSYNEIIKLKGIGPYTAAAIASFAFNENRAVLDGNVFRVLSRIYNEDASISEAKNRKLFQGLVDNLLPEGKAAEFNQAIMDFGAIQCKPKNPSCSSCVLSEFCEAHRKDTVSQLPVKKKAAKKKDRYFYFLDLRPKEGDFPVVKRREKDIWQGLYSFPFIDSKVPLTTLSTEVWESKLKLNLTSLPELEWETKHILSHQILHCTFYRLKESNVLNEQRISYSNKEYSWIKNVEDVPWPVVISKYFNRLNINK